MRMTVDEIRLVAFIILGLLVGATVKHWRDVQRALSNPAPESAPAIRKTPDGRNRRSSLDAEKNKVRR